LRPDALGRGRLLIASAAAIALLVSACGRSGAHRTSASAPTYHPRGTLLVETGGFRSRLISYPLPSGPQRQFSEPVVGFFQNFEGAFLGPKGTAYVLIPINCGPQWQSLLFQVSLTTESREVAGLLSIPFGGTLDVRGGRALATGCFRNRRSIYVLDLAAGGNWRSVASGCAAALSPDGTALAYFDDGSLFRMSLPNGRPEWLLSMTSVPGLRAAGISRIPSGSVSIAWGRGGISLFGGTRNAWALVVYRPGHPPITVPLGSPTPQTMVWQPQGPLLGFSDYVDSSQTIEVRVLDTATGAISQVAVTQNYGRFQWSPDGRVLAVGRSSQVISFIDLQGRVLATNAAGGLPDAWTP